MKKMLGVLLLLCFLLTEAWPALGASRLLCTTFPIYLFTRNLTQDTDYFQVELLVNSQLGCPHDYVLTPDNLERLSLAEVLVINGLGLESFLEQALRVARPDLTIIDSSRASPPALEEGNSASEDFSNHPEESPSPYQSGPNPHLFASPRSAMTQVNSIVQELIRLDPDRTEVYISNASAYLAALQKVDSELAGLSAVLGGDVTIIVSHSIFDYMTRDMGLQVAATIEEVDGIDPSAARLADLSRLAADSGAAAILVDPQGNVRLAATLGQEVGLPTGIIDFVASGPADPPLDYYQKVWSENLEILRRLLEPPQQPQP